MKTRALFATLLLFSVFPRLRAQDIAPDSTNAAPGVVVTPKQSRLTQLSQAYGFLIGQHASLLAIETKFPELAPVAMQSWVAFNSGALGESGKGVEAELSKQLGDKWPEMKAKITAQMQQMAASQQVTKEKAAAFLAEVNSRAKGELAEAIRATLLSANPRYAVVPGLEISEGWIQTFRTKDHPKARGVDFSISLPASWSKREGNRPNIIQFFQSGAGHGPAMCALMAKELPVPAGFKLTPEEAKEFFFPEELKKWLSGDGKVIEAQSLMLEGAPAGMVVQDHTQQRLDIVITSRLTQFVTFQGNALIAIQFSVMQFPGQPETLDDLQKKYLPAYRSIVNTYVNNDKYR